MIILHNLHNLLYLKAVLCYKLKYIAVRLSFSRFAYIDILNLHFFILVKLPLGSVESFNNVVSATEVILKCTVVKGETELGDIVYEPI
jgi:hypothetical protein